MKKFKPFVKLILVATFLLCSGCSSSPSDEDIMLSYIIAGNKAAEMGKFELAKKEYNLALKINPNSNTAKRNLGIVLVKLGLYKDAIDSLKEISPTYPKDPEVYYFLGESYRGISLYSDAVDAYNNGLNFSAKDARIIKSLAWVYLKQNKPLAAKNLIQGYYKQDPNDVQLMLIMSGIHNKMKNYDKTIKTLKIFESSNFKLKSSNKELAETEKILLLDSLGEAYFGLNNCEKSQKIYEIILNTRPFLASALMKSAKCDIKLNRTHDAEVKLEKAQASEPNNVDILFWLGYIYTSSDPKKSSFYYQRFLDRSEHDPTYSSEVLRAQSAVGRVNN
ncbi:MAG: tetratricopeptide repeat protein [Bdellovibrionota bacterium]